MRPFNTGHYLFKAMAGAMACIFLWHEVAWGSDFASRPAETRIDQLNKEASQRFAPQYLQDQQAIHESIISRKQAIEDAGPLASMITSSQTTETAPASPAIELKGPQGGSSGGAAAYMLAGLPEGGSPAGSGADGAVLTVTTQDGDVIHYLQGIIDHIEKADGTTLRDIILDEDNNLLGAEITYGDGTVQIVAGGRAVQMMRPDGVIFRYAPDELIESVVYPDGRTVAYSYVRDPEGNIIETVLTDADTDAYYDSARRLRRVVQSDGRRIEYQDGMLAGIFEPDGAVYSFVIENRLLEDGSQGYTVRLGSYRDASGATYHYQDNTLVSADLADGGVVSGITVNDDGTLRGGTITLADGTVRTVTDGELSSSVKADGTRLDYERSGDGTLTKIRVTTNTGMILDYAPNGCLIAGIGPDGVVTAYQDGLIISRTYTTGLADTYSREYDYALKPFRLTIKDAAAYARTYLFDGAGAIIASGADRELPAQTPFSIPKSQLLPAQGYMQSSGVITTDGTYLYVKRWGTNAGSDTFEKIGTGYNGTIAGKNYGTLAASYSSCSATYYSDGNIYNPIVSNAYTLEKISVTAGTRAQIDIASGLLERSSGKVKAGTSLITSDGRYIYNLAYHIDNGSTTTYNGWTVKVFDPQNNWQVTKAFTTATTSFLANGIVSDGVYLYAIQWTKKDTAKVTKISLTTNAVAGTFTINQATTNAINGQYDWVNGKFWLGSATQSSIYRYKTDIVTYKPLAAANQEAAFASESILNSRGVLATDGTYYYVKRWGTYTGSDTFEKIGTGNNGTIAGKNYGTLAASTRSYSATYYPDGAVYNPIYSNAYKLERIDVATGVKTQIDVAAGLLERASGTVKSGSNCYSLITSDGRYVYNVASHIANGSTTTYNGWTVRVFDPQNDWQEVKTYTVGTASYATNGIVADGVYLYCIQWKNANTAKITVSRIADGVIVKTFTVNQAATGVVNGQYDWVNNTICLGALTHNGIGVYGGLIKKAGLASIDTDGLITPSRHAAIAAGDLDVSVPSLPGKGLIESATQARELVYTAAYTLKQAVQYDGTTLDFTDGLVDSASRGAETTVYGYALDDTALAEISIDRDGIRRIYDAYGSLTSLAIDGTATITYEDGTVKTIEKADGTTIKNITFRESGELDGALIAYPDGSLAVYDDAELFSVIAASGSAVYCSDGKVRRVVLDSGDIYDWYYAEGSIIIVDNARREKRFYREGRLEALEELAGARLTTRYFYDDTSHDLIASVISQNNETLYGYTYTYEDGLTVIHDEDGNAQAYTKDKKLSYIIDAQGKRYSYTYVGKNEGYVEVYFPSGAKARYDAQGEITEIIQPDGTVIRDIVFDGAGVPRDFIYTKDGTVYTVSAGKVTGSVTEDARIAYGDSGFITSVQDASGMVYDYTCFISDVKTLNAPDTFSRGSCNGLTPDTDDHVTFLTLSRPLLDLGDGSDGDLRVEAGTQVTIHGTKNYKSIYVAPGATLAVDAWDGTTGGELLLKCQGSVVIDGTLTASGKGYRGGDTSGGQGTYAESGEIADSGGGAGGYNGVKDTSIGTSGAGGVSIGDESLADLRMGSGGGKGGAWWGASGSGGNGGAGGGKIKVMARSVTINGSISVNGQNGSDGASNGGGGGGGGSGGAVWVVADNLILNGTIAAAGGSGGVSYAEGHYAGGAGGAGRIRIDYGTVGGAFLPPESAYQQQLEFCAVGTFESEVIALDALEPESLSWDQDVPAGTFLAFQTRTGDTLVPDSSWSEWSAPLFDAGGSPITSGAGTYMQYKVTMMTIDAHTSPAVKLSDTDSIDIRYKRAPREASDLSSLAHFTLEGGGVTFVYNADGLLTEIKDATGTIAEFDPPSTSNSIDPALLVFDDTYCNGLAAAIPSYILNDTQKEVYLKDDIIVSELTGIGKVDGNFTEYRQGKISSIVRADGTVITDIAFGPDGSLQSFTYGMNGFICSVKDGELDEVVTPSGERIHYYPYGLVKSVENSSFRRDLVYGVAAAGTYTTGAAFRDGACDGTYYEEDGYASYLKLAQPLLDTGDGSDGDLYLEAGAYLTIHGTKNYKSIYVAPGATLAVDAWDGTTGGELLLKCQGSVVIDGTLTASGKGYRGGDSSGGQGTYAEQGESPLGTGAYSSAANGGAGGGGRNGIANVAVGSSAGGGGYGTVGAYAGCAVGGGTLSGSGGARYGDEELDDFLMGSGGGKGGAWWGASGSGGNGGAGGGKIKVMARSVTINGSISVNGQNGSDGASNGGGGGGGGSGGAVWVVADNLILNGAITAAGGAGGVSYAEGHYAGGAGGAGRIRIDYGTVGGAFLPPESAYAKRLDYASSGTFESEILDLEAIELGTLSWSQDLPAGTEISIRTRTGDTPLVDSSWSEWSEAVTDPAGSPVASAGKKYLQYAITLSSSTSYTTPKVIINDANPLSIEYRTFSSSATDPYVTVREGATATAYNASGALIWIEDAFGVRTTFDPNNSPVTINLAELRCDTFYTDLLAEDIPSSRLSDAQKVITVYDQGNDIPVEIVTAGQTITYFDDGFATKVVDKDGTVQVLYTYDEEKNILTTEFVDARQKLEESYRKALDEIVTQRDAALARIAAAEADARVDIAARSAEILQEIAAARERLAHEKTKYDPNVYDLSEFDRAFAEIGEYEVKLAAETDAAYVDLASQIAAARDRIEEDAATAIGDLIVNDYNKILADIVQKESAPVIYHYYRKVLGRDPGEDDLLYWTDKAKAELKAVGAGEITSYLRGLQEYSERETRKADIVAGLAAFFIQYLALSEADKAAMAVSLGLDPSELAALSREDVDGILAWLEGQSLHFGDSAFEAIRTMLAASGIERPFEEVGTKALMVDILTGVITKETTGDLTISMYAMRRVAAAQGLALYAGKLTYDDLEDRATRHNVIVHVDGKHYIVVKSVDDAAGTVTYSDPTVGAAGEEIVVTRAEFMGMWKGHALVQEELQDPAKRLSVTQEKNIRGSGWWEDFWKGIVKFFQKIIAPVAAILLMIPPVAAIGAVLSGINIVIQTISFVVHTGTLMDVAWAAITGIGAAIGGQILPNILQTAGQVFGQIGSAIFAPLKGVFSSVMPIFGTLSTAVKNIATGIGQIVSFGTAQAEIMTSIGYNIITQGISLGTDFIFRSMDLDPSLSAIGSALMTGAIVGAVGPTTNIVGEALKYGTIAAVEELGEVIDLDPNITHLSAMLAGALVGGAIEISGQTITYSELMESIAPNIASECAYLGLTELGELIGIDERISYLAGVGIRSGLQIGYAKDPVTGEWKFDPEKTWTGVQNGLLRGITSVSLEWGAESLGLSPLIGSLTSAAIAGGLEALLMGQNPVQGVYDTYFRAGTGLLTLGGDGGNSPWLRAAYISQVLDFSQIIQEQGIANALETYATGFLHQQTINEIWKQGGIADLLAKPNQVEMTTNAKGEVVKRVYTMAINSESDKLLSNYIDLSPTYDMLVGYREGNVITHCEFVIGPDGRSQLKNGEREIWDGDGSYRIEYVEDFNLTRIEYYDSVDDMIGLALPTAGASSIMVDGDDNISNGDFVSLITDYNVSIKDDQVTDLSFKRDCIFDTADVTALLGLGLTEQDIAGFKEVVSLVNGMVEYYVLPPETAIFNINTEKGRAWRESIEARGQSFWATVDYLIGEHLSTDPLPEVTEDSIFPLANINSHIGFPGDSESIPGYAMSFFSLAVGDLASPANELSQALIASSRWAYNTNRSAELIATSLAMEYQFVFDGGVDTIGLDASKQNAFYYSFDTTESIAVGNSAGVTSMVKSWSISGYPQAENYFLFTPQFISPDYVWEQMRLAGIPADRVTVVEIAGDFVTTTGFQNSYDSNGNKKWNYVKLQSGGNLSWWNIYGNHGAVVNGIIDGSVYDEIIDDGKIYTGVTLVEILKKKL